jgi:hypothetical protein
MATRSTITTPKHERMGGIDADEIEIVNPETKFSIEDTIRGTNPMLDSAVISTDKIYANEDLEREKFMAEELEIHLMEAGSDDEPQFVEVRVNGDYRMGVRGNSLFMKRYHVAVLAQAKEQRLQQKKIVNLDGSMGYQEMMVSRPTYPFTVIHDPSGLKGSDWLRQQMKNPV